MLGKILTVDQNNYPEMLGHTCLINAGAVVSFLFRFIKPMLDIRTQNKIEVRYREALSTRQVDLSDPTSVLPSIGSLQPCRCRGYSDLKAIGVQ